MIIREAVKEDYDPVWEIFSHVIQTGDTYVFDPGTPKEHLARHWFAPYMKTFVAEEKGRIVGTYIIKPNQIGLGSHIANCSYMVHPDARGMGTGGALCEHSVGYARRSGYRAIQFNIVVSTNTTAVRLWQKYGFSIIGTIPGGFNQTGKGFVDAYIMFRPL